MKKKLKKKLFIRSLGWQMATLWGDYGEDSRSVGEVRYVSTDRRF